MIKLIAIDMDGTLLDSQKKLPQENIDAIQEAVAVGIKIVICTGRSQAGVKPYFEQLGLHEEEYVILNNGCSLHETLNWSTLYGKSLSHSDILGLQSYVDDNLEVDMVLTTNKDYYFVGETPSKIAQADADSVFTNLLPIKKDAISTIEEPVYNAMYMGTSKAIDAFQNKHEAEILEAYTGVRSQDLLYEVLPQHSNKATGLAELVKLLGLDPSQIMTIGDGNNDIEMLDFSGFAVAMENASDAVKAHADKITLRNDQAGVAYAIREFVLKS